MSALTRVVALSRSASVLRGCTLTQRANLSTRAPKDALGPLETAIGIAMFSLAIMGPPGWILANLENYKAKAGGSSD